MKSAVRGTLICGITPYFLEKGNFWFEENLKKILSARKTQSFFEANTIYIEKDKDCNFSKFLRKLDEMGYEKVFQVLEPGEFSQRGGIVDVFPINMDNAVRIEFVGNEIEEIEILANIKVKNEKLVKNVLKKRLKSQKLFSDLKGLKPGDYLVHLDHGVGKFIGFIEQKSASDSNQVYPPKYYLIEYAAQDRLFVPLGLERKLSRYIGFSEPKISRLGSLLWQKTKRRIKEETKKLAKELLEIYAKRQISSRPPYLPDDEFDSYIASSFKYEETPDQVAAIEEIKKDLSKNKPMDRLLCGDVGFGKTEIALRTMVRVVKSGYQSLLLCPTTILANQHFQNIKERCKSLPIRVDILSRIEPKAKQREIIERLKRGYIDILVGTQRVLSNDVSFKNLGLVVIDDEQKFGVKQKEKFKRMRSSLDVLSLSATPIPRTLYLALSSLRDISIIRIPPKGRLPIKTFVLPFSKRIIKKAVENELKRKGQVYYLHNRVETINKAKIFLKNLVPEARISVVHGRLKEKEIIRVMTDFQKGKIDILVATTIIENGLDLPNVNTLLVADSARLGLSQAHQIRGRIGRSHVQALAYFFYHQPLGERGKLRLKVLKREQSLGSGYRIALEDLKIRGAGDILGREQSGNINRVGLNLYCQMLSEAIEKLKLK